MKIIIAGAGGVGFYLAKFLSYEFQNITLIDISEESLSYADSHLDIKIIKGDVTSFEVLEDAQVSTSDMFIGVTSSETTNFTACIIAKQLGVKHTVARISNSDFIDNKPKIDFKKLGIDELISPEHLAASEIQLLLNSAFSNTYEFEQGALNMIGTTLISQTKFLKKTVMQVAQEYTDIQFVTIAIRRKGTEYTIIPRGNTMFEEGDQVYFMITKDDEKRLYDLVGKEKKNIENVMVLGGGRVGTKTAKELCSKKFNVKLIEKNKRKARELAEELTETLVIHGDGCNVELLEEEDFDNMDAFIAVTPNSETNIMSCLLANNKNIKKTIALVENTDYLHLSHSIGIDTIINKKLLVAANIFRYVRKGDVVALTKLNNMEGEILEFVVNSDSDICNQHIKDLDFPRSAIIGGVIRQGTGIIALGDFKIEINDRVVVCCLPEAIAKVEKLFFTK